MTTSELVAAVTDEVRAFRPIAASQLLVELTRELKRGPGSMTEVQARGLVQEMLRNRWFAMAVDAGTAISRSGFRSAKLARQLAQALIDSGRLVDGRELLERTLRDNPPASQVDLAELRGTLGRALKQLAVNGLRNYGALDESLILDAIAAYQSAYDLDRATLTWQGVNVVACAYFGLRHGIGADRLVAPAPLAQAVLADLNAAAAKDQWWSATRAEALVATGRFNEALSALVSYCEHPAVDAFSLGSTLRQFDEIWELGHADDGSNDLLTMLRARLLEVERGYQRMDARGIQRVRDYNIPSTYQAVFGDGRYRALGWLKAAIDRCASVARIGTETEFGGGTGFVLPGNRLCERWGAELVLLTNSHVIAEDGRAFATPARARIRFEAATTAKATDVFHGGRILHWSPREHLDFSVVTLDPPRPPEPPMPIAATLPLVGAGRVNLIGHPAGSDIAFSFVHNSLIAANNTYLQYRAPTEGGSSGSPIFNDRWELVGVHHRGGDDLPRIDGVAANHQANQGVRLDSIIAAINT